MKFRRTVLLLILTALAVGSVSCKGRNTVPWPDEEIDAGGEYIAPAGADNTELSVSRYKSAGDPGEQTVTYRYGTDGAAFTLREADAAGNKVTLRAGTVSALNFDNAFPDGTVAKYSMRIQIAPAGSTSTWNTFYFGLRLPDKGRDATSKTGVWIALREDSIGMRTGAWPETTFKKLSVSGVDFRQERMLYVEDDMENDVISVYADNDAGEKTLLAAVKIEGDAVALTLSGNDTPSIKDKGVDVPGNGYVNCWLHHMKEGPTYITDFTASGLSAGSVEVQAANMLASRDVFSDTWVAADDTGRILSAGKKPASSKKVGIFYFLWHDPAIHGGDRKIYDHSAAYYGGGVDALKKIITQGPLGFAHYWAEPYFGYYRSDDEWVIRKHTQQLVDAGIDFIFIDATNGLTYEKTYKTILKIWAQMRAEGSQTPYIAFHCGINTDAGPKSFKALWNDLYGPGLYSDLWFIYDGKPLIFLPQSYHEMLPEEQKNFFTVRYSWANTDDGWYSDNGGKLCWPWADMYPQKPGLSASGSPEQMVVMSGFWANGSFGTNGGRSYSYKNGGQPEDNNFGFTLTDEGKSGLGIAFQEQFDRAIKTDPGLIMLIGWNEWWAGRWEASPAVGQTIANTYRVTDNGNWTRHYYVDNFNPEFSRDIEPVKGLYNDNYYYQMAMNVRDYKGSRAPLSAFGQRDIDMSGPVSQWDIVGPEYRDSAGDVTHRDSASYVGGLRYTNESGRNDIILSKVSRSGDKITFFVECADDITAPEGTNWMNLFIDSDCDQKTGWYGFDYVIDRTRTGDGCSIERFVDGSWNTQNAGNAEISLSGRYLQISFSASLLDLGKTFDFKWADNSVSDGDIMQFTDMGDTAPNGRFCYRFTEEKVRVDLPGMLTEDMIVLKAGSYYAYAGGKAVRLDASSTKAVFTGDDEHLYVPKEFAELTMGIDVGGLREFNHYGIKYVDVAAVIGAQGKTVTRGENIIVLADCGLSTDELLLLYRSMY